jgi:hypothetical protein
MTGEGGSIIVAPSILSADFGHLADEIRAVDAAIAAIRDSGLPFVGRKS